MKISRAPIYLIVTVFVLLAGMFLQLRLYDTHMRDVLHEVRNLETSVKRLKDEIGHISAAHVPTLNDLQLASLRHQEVKLRAYDIKLVAEFDSLMSIGGSDDKLRFPTYTAEHRDVPFHPYQWSVNLLSLSRFVRLGTGPYSLIEAKVNQLLDQMQHHSIVQGSAMFVRYPFAHSSCGSVREPEWVSGFGQGYVLAALVSLYRVFADAKVKKLADDIFESFLIFKRQADNGRWVSFIDDAQYLWFEEYPTPTGPQPRVLNGHVGALMGIYAYHRLWPNDEAKLLLQAGMTSVQRYFVDFRRPGGVNRYCLLDRDSVDYGPKRAILQQRWLYDITGDAFFAQAAAALMTDMAFK